MFPRDLALSNWSAQWRGPLVTPPLHWDSSTSLCLTLYMGAGAELKPSFLQGKRSINALSQPCRKSNLTRAFSALHMAHLPSVKRPRCWGNEANMELSSHREMSGLFIGRTLQKSLYGQQWQIVSPCQGPLQSGEQEANRPRGGNIQGATDEFASVTQRRCG